MTDSNGNVEVEGTVGKTEILAEVWLVNGPFEDGWSRQYNREVWLSESWKNDATGFSFVDEVASGTSKKDSDPNVHDVD